MSQHIFLVTFICNAYLISIVLSFTNRLRPSLVSRSFQNIVSSKAVSDNSHNTEDSLKTPKKLIDQAPCLDGFCSSQPSEEYPLIQEVDPTHFSIDTTVGGQAMERLGADKIGPTVWSEFGRLAQEYKVQANLGQGFPNWTPPQFAIDSLVEAALDCSHMSPHQYTRTAGHVNLVVQLARRYSIHLKRTVHAMNEVAVTVGASQALYLSLQTLLRPGDEVVIFEPFFDLYVNQIKLAGGKPVFVPLTFVPYSQDEASGGDWILEPSVLFQAISPRTRAIILNSPHNPTGKIFNLREMETIAQAAMNAGPQCIVLTDEVYKYIVHSPLKETIAGPTDCKSSDSIHKGTEAQSGGKNISCPDHIHFATLPHMWERTITISSAGKTFSATGWQVGWCIGPKHLITPIHQLLPYVQFCASTVIQEALARTLPKADEPYQGYSSYYHYLKAIYTRKRDLLGRALKAAGFGIPNYEVSSGGGFFIFARIGDKISKCIPRDRIMVFNPAAPGHVARQDWALCEWLVQEKGVLFIPSSPFFSAERASRGDSDQFVRIAFCKTDETIETAARALISLTGKEQERMNENVEDRQVMLN